MQILRDVSTPYKSYDNAFLVYPTVVFVLPAVSVSAGELTGASDLATCSFLWTFFEYLLSSHLWVSGQVLSKLLLLLVQLFHLQESQVICALLFVMRCWYKYLYRYLKHCRYINGFGVGIATYFNVKYRREKMLHLFLCRFWVLLLLCPAAWLMFYVFLEFKESF